MKQTGFAYLLLVPWLVTVPAVAQSEQDDAPAPSTREQVAAIFAEYDRTDSPGCALGVIRDGELIFARGYGMANLEYGIANSPQSVFRIGSTSKQFTAAVIVLLAREGKLSLDDDVREHLPELWPHDPPLTIRQLIHHTSGIRDYLLLMYLAGYTDEDHYTDDDALEVLAGQRSLNFAPGTEHLYSNSGYFLLSRIVEAASGQSLREYAAKKIFAPLGMRHTHFHDDHRGVVANRASGYRPREDDEGFEISMTTLEMVGDGGVFTTVEDLLLWDRNFYDNKLGEGFLETMLTRGLLDDGEELDYAFGLGHREHNGLPIVAHGGAFVGFRAEMVRFPTERFSVICLCNLSTTSPSRLALEVADVYLAERYSEQGPEGGAGRESAEAAGESDIPAVEVREEALQALAGLYFNDPAKNVRRILVRDGGLVYSRGPDSETDLRPLGERRFRMLDVPSRVDVWFEPSQGKPQRMLVRIDDQEPLALDAVDEASYDTEELSGFAGSYHSEELNVTYRLVVEDGRLVVHGAADSHVVEPAFTDFFRGVEWPLVLEFDRDDAGTPDRFSLSAGRVRNLVFVRR